MRRIALEVVVLFSAALLTQAAINGPGCGQRNLYNPTSDTNDKDADPAKIVGGNVTLVGDHMWQIAIYRLNSLVCSGALIDEYTVMTAAHCTTNLNAGQYNLVRTWNRAPFDASFSQQRTPVRIVNHEAFQAATYNNDISLLFVSQPFTFDLIYTGPLCVSQQNPAVNQTSIVAGWGATFSGGSQVQQLRDARMLITNPTHITSQYSSLYNPTTMLGAAYIGDGVDACTGDSGGALSVASNGGSTDQDLKNLQAVGISSWGFGCGNTGIYTRVSTYYSWIQQQNREFLRSIGKLNE